MELSPRAMKVWRRLRLGFGLDGVTAPQQVVGPSEIVVEVVVDNQTVWAKTFDLFSAPEDVGAAVAAVQHAVLRDGLLSETSLPFQFEIYCDTAAELRIYVEA